MEINVLAGLLILAGDVWAILNVIGSRAEPALKLVWSLVVLLLPVIGLVIWLLTGPRSKPV